MKSFAKIKKQIPMPDTCPFCGTRLNTENAQIDHIIPPSLGGTDDIDNLRYLCKECNSRKADRYNPLFEYYLRLMRNNGLSDKYSAKKIDFVLRSISDKDLAVLVDRVEEKDAAFRRIRAYAKAIAKMQGKESSDILEPSSDELAELMISTLAAYDNYDVETETREKINGNIFVFSKDFPIEKYRDILISYGDDEQDEIYSVYLDEEGRLVVY